MPYIITEECIVCNACVDDCPTEAISEGDDIFLIDQDKCIECVEESDEAQCVEVCPIDDCIILDPNNKMSKDDLIARRNELLG